MIETHSVRALFGVPLVFDALSETRGVYLFDEVDALGGERARTNDVGEIRRVLNSFLQFLEMDDAESILVAATNHPQMLDRAGLRLQDFDIYEIHEAFAAQVLCTLKAWEDEGYCREKLGRSAMGAIDRAKLNPKRSIFW